MSLPNSIATVDSAHIDILNQDLNEKQITSHLGIAKIRGIIPLFNSFFKLESSDGRKRRLTKDAKKQRWITYKKIMYKDYGRLIKGTFNSEQALVTRYSNPLAFLKYKLKRTKNLKPTDLSDADYAYYKEIGGKDDVEQMLRQRANIDSIGSAVRFVQKRRLNKDTVDLTTQIINNSISNVENNNHNNNNNNNNHNNNNNNRSNTISTANHEVIIDLIPPSVDIKHEHSQSVWMNGALNQLKNDMDIFEVEQLKKKKN